MTGLILTFLKPFTTGLVIYFIINGYKFSAALTILLLIFCDIFDGILFCKSNLALNQKLSWLRRVVDIIGDRIAIQVILIFMIIYSNFPIYLYVVETIREIFLLCIWYYGFKTENPIREPNLPSRFSNLSVGLMAISWFTLPVLTPLFLLPAVVFGIFGCLKYWKIVYSRHAYKRF